MKDKRKTKAQSILDMEKEKDRENRGLTMEGGEQMEKRDAVKTTTPLHFIAQGVIPVFIVIIAILAILDIRVVFEPPLLLFILNTLFISVMSFAVASISARNYLERGSLSFLLLGCGVLAFGSGGLVAGWLIGPPGGPNVNVTIYDTGALLGAVFHATGAIFASAGVTSDIILVLKRKSKMILAYLGVLLFTALLTTASLRGAIPPYIIQGIGPTLLGRAVLGTAVALFGISSLFFMRLYSKSKETFQYWYSLALALIAVGLSAVFLQKAVGSPIGWAGRSAQFLGGIYFLIAVLITYMEGRLRISEEKLRSVFASSPDAITVIDLNRNILECSQSALDVHGCSSKDEVLGRNAFEFIAKKDHERAMENLKKTLEQGSVKDIEYTFLTKDGCEFPVELSASVIKDAYGNPTGFVVIARDITERKRAEETLRESQQLLEKTFASLEEAVFVVDPTTRTVIACNPAVERIFGYDEKEVIGNNTEFLHVDRTMYERFGQELFPALDADGVFHTQFQMRRKDGSVFFSEHTVTEIVDGSGHRTGVVSVVRDITERVRAEEALRRSLEETARGHHLLLVLSQAAQAVQRARTPDEVYQTVGDEVAKLGYNAAIFTLTDDRAHLAIPHLTFEPTLLRAAEKLTGLSAQGYRFPLVPSGLFQRIIADGETTFIEPTSDLIAEALPGPVRPLAGRVVALLGIEQGIIAPLTVGGETQGLLVVTGAGLTEADVSAVTAFANQTAIALNNAGLLEAITKHRRDLQRLSAQIIKAQEAERKRISRELHDELGQALTGLKLLLDMSTHLPADEVTASLGEAQALVNELVARVRDLSLDLRPSMLDDLGLLPALLWHFDRYTAQTPVRVTFKHSGLEGRFGPEVETAAYRIVQEALTNVARHAGVDQVTVRLWADQATLGVQIEDRGAGFDLEAALASGATTGLAGMRERAVLLGGQLTVESAPGAGTRVTAELPLGDPAEKGEKGR